MPWKEPGDKPSEPRGREPWGQTGRGGGPDLDTWLRNLRRRLGPFGRGPLGVLAVVVLLIVLWFLVGGWVSVGNQQVGVLLRFGRLQGVLQPGLHVRFPSPIDRVQIVDLGRTHTLSDDVRLLTSDGQLAIVDYYVQYRIKDARKFLFEARDAEESARNVATVAVRAVAGTHTLQELMDRSDEKLGGDIRERLQPALARLDVGIAVAGVGIQNVGVPSEVRQAFDGIARAREDAKSAQATAHADVARAKAETAAQAAAVQTDAASYRHQAVAEAQAESARFGQLLQAYQAAPQVVRHRLWLETMHEVLSKNHVVVNTGSGNVIVQFPQRQVQPSPAASSAAPASGAPASAVSSAPAGSATVPVTAGPALQGVGT